MRELKRELGLWTAIAIVIGTTIGSGIFLVPTAMMREMGSPGMVFLVWIAGGLLSLFGALTYAELSTRFPEAGGEYVFLREAYGPFWGFLYGWLQTWMARSGAAATLAAGFLVYVTHFFPALGNVWLTVPLPIGPNWGPLEVRYGQLLAIVVICFLGLLNSRGVRLSAGVHVGLTAVKIALIAMVIGTGLFFSSEGSMANYSGSIPPASQSSGFMHFFAALVAALWAYDGWNTVSMVAGEVKDPRRNLPRALIGGILGIAAIYLAANAAYFYVLTPAQAATSERIAAEMMRRAVGGWGASAVSLAAIVSMFAALNGTVLGGSRITYAMARDGYFFAAAGKVHEKHGTPANAIWILTAWACVLVLSGRYEQLFTGVVFASWILYAMAAASIFVFRKRGAGSSQRSFGYPVLPALFVATAVLLLGATLVQSPRESLIGLAIIAFGVPYYLRANGNGKREGVRVPFPSKDS